jgi:hypothetical protein
LGREAVFYRQDGKKYTIDRNHALVAVIGTFVVSSLIAMISVDNIFLPILAVKEPLHAPTISVPAVACEFY